MMEHTMTEHKVNVEFGGRIITIATGKWAKQASGAVVVSCGDTVVLVTAVATKSAREGQDFFPLTVNYQEKAYAGGKIPGGFFKREGRPSDNETLTCRFIDRPIRPLFPESFLNDTQIMATVVSADQDNDPGILAMIGASAALEVSDIPFLGPIAGVKVGRVDGQFVCNPTVEQLEKSDLEIVVAASRDAVIMVEGGLQRRPKRMSWKLFSSVTPLFSRLLRPRPISVSWLVFPSARLRPSLLMRP